MKIAIDCRMLGMSGVGVFLKNFLDYTLFDYSDINFLLIGSSKCNIYSECSNVTIKVVEIPPFSIKEYLCFPVKEINLCDIYFSPNYNVPFGIKIPICCTIHDLLFWDVKGISSFVGRWIRIFAVKRAYYLSNLIFTVSKFSSCRIAKHLGNKQTVVTYNALRPYIKCSNTLVPEKQYIVFVGNIKPHKGLKDLLSAYQDYGLYYEYDLIIVGNYQSFRTSYPEIFEYENVEGVSFVGNVSDENLLDLIGNAAMLVQPSIYEGFGIPPLEALFLGIPVVLSDIPVFKEIYSDFPVIFFECKNPKSLSEAIRFVTPYTETMIKGIRDKISFKYSSSNMSNIIMQELIKISNESSTNR